MVRSTTFELFTNWNIFCISVKKKKQRLVDSLDLVWRAIAVKSESIDSDSKVLYHYILRCEDISRCVIIVSVSIVCCHMINLRASLH